MAKQLNTAGWIRLVIYAISALVGVAAVVALTIGSTELAALLTALSSAGAAITGGTAIANLPKAPDQHPTAGFELREAVPALREIADAARTYREAVEYQGEHRRPEG